MQKSNKPFYDIREYADDGSLMLVRIQEREYQSTGLPPTVSQCIMMNKNEIEQLMEILNAYERRNKEL
jgi:hypothetical protein